MDGEIGYIGVKMGIVNNAERDERGGNPVRRIVLLFSAFLAISSFFPTAYAQHHSRPQSVTVISIPGFSFAHLENADLTPQFKRLVDEGSIGAMNLRTAGSDTLANSYATLAAGRRVTVPQPEPFYQLNETLQGRPVSAWISERIGITPRSGTVFPNLVPFAEKNQVGAMRVQQIVLGEVLRQAGLGTAVWGNADWGEERVRFAPFLSMNRDGHTVEAAVDDRVLVAAKGFPFGVKTNYAYVLDEVRHTAAELRVVELGDLYRLQREAAKMTEQRVKAVEREILKEVDRFLQQFLTTLSPGDVVWIISPYTQQSYPKYKSQLAPAICYREGQDGGIMFSPTTRRIGIIANIDFAPTVLETFQIPKPAWMDGQPITVTNGEEDAFWETLEQVETVFHLRPYVIYAYALYQVVAFIIALGLLLGKKTRGTGLLQIALLASIVTPFLFLVLAAVSPFSYRLFLVLWVFSALLMALSLKRLPTVPLFFVLGLVGFAPVIVDGLLGGHLIRQSFLGYDPIIGARYYGIGNEYMGVVIGAVLLMVAAWLEWKRPTGRWMKAGTAFLFVFLVLYFAAPFWGTNAGGALAASAGFGVAYARFFHSRMDWRFWLAFAALGVAGVSLLFIMNVVLDVSAPSHIGQAFGHLLKGDIAQIVDIASRKLATNVRLIKGSLWGRVFFVSLLAMAVLIIQPLRGIRWLKTRYPYMFHGFTAILVSALSALVFNDSGIVSAATAIAYVVIPLLLIVCREWMPHYERS